MFIRESKSIDNAEITGKLIIIGDLHTSPKYTGTHKDYANSSIRVLDLVEEILQSEKTGGKKVSLALLGDTFGVNERNFNNEFFLTEVGRRYGRFNDLCEGRVFSVRGNHDMGEYTTFDFAVDNRWLSNPKYVDMLNDNNEKVVRFHLVNYGREDEPLDILETGSNVILGHNDYSVPGITPTYGGKTSETVRGDKVLVSKHDNFLGVQQIISGHIHTPLVKQGVEAEMSDGSMIEVYYPGSPSRVAEHYDTCYRFVYETSGDAINWHITPINLWPDDEEFIENKTTEEVKERVKDLDRQQANLEEILATVTESRLTEQFDNRAQLGIIPGFSDEARDEARKRYDKFASAGRDDE